VKLLLVALLVALVLANGLAFAWWNGHLTSFVGDGRELERIKSQVAAEKAKLVPVSRLIPALTAANYPLCIDYPAVLEARSAEFEKQLEALGIEKATPIKIEKTTLNEGGTFLVYLSPSATLREAQRKLFELKRVGIEDVALIAEGDLKWAISLGLFSSDEAVRSRTQQLTRAGIPGAKVSPRSAVVIKVAIKARAIDLELKAPMLALSMAALTSEAKVCSN
jgi:hypothetical protein